MKQRIIAALFLAGFATASLAQGAAQSAAQASPVAGLDTVVVENADSCPAGFYPSIPSYTFKDGHFVQNGWACDSFYWQNHE